MAFFNPGTLRKAQEWVWKGFVFSFCSLMYSELGFVLEYRPFPTSVSAGGFPAWGGAGMYWLYPGNLCCVTALRSSPLFWETSRAGWWRGADLTSSWTARAGIWGIWEGKWPWRWGNAFQECSCLPSGLWVKAVGCKMWNPAHLPLFVDSF